MYTPFKVEKKERRKHSKSTIFPLFYSIESGGGVLKSNLFPENGPSL